MRRPIKNPPLDVQTPREIRHAYMGPIILALGALFVGLAPIGLRLSEQGPQATALWRFVLAIPMVIGFARLRGLPITPPTLPAIATGVFFGLDIALWHQALTMTSVANATFIVNLGAIGSGLLAWVFMHQRPARLWPIAAAITIGGAAAMAFGRGATGSGSLSGDLVAMCAATMLAGYFVSMSIARSRSDAVSVIFWATCSASLVALVVTVLVGEPLLPASPMGWAAPLFLAVFAQVLGQGFLIWGGGMAPPSVSGVIVMLQPVCAGLIAWPLFNETLSPVQLVGAAGILAGVYLAGRRR